MAQPPPLCFSPDRPDPAGYQANQGTEAQSSVSGPTLEEPALILGAGTAYCSPVAHSPETKPPLSQVNGMIWHPHPDLWALHLWPLDGSLQSSLRMC